jgi:hypothetical protein
MIYGHMRDANEVKTQSTSREVQDKNDRVVHPLICQWSLKIASTRQVAHMRLRQVERQGGQ